MALGSLWAEFKTFAFKGNMIDLAVAVVIGAAFSGVINSLVQDMIMPGIIYLTTTAAEAKEKATNIVAGPATAPAPPQATDEEKANAAALLATAGKNISVSMTPLVKAYQDVQTLQGMKAKLPTDVQGQIDKESADLLSIQQANGMAAPAPPPPPPAPAQPKAVEFNWKVGPFNVGSFIGSLINFLLIAAAVFVTIVKLLGSVMKRMGPKETAPSEPVTKECPFCLSIIPIKARKCSHCTADLPATATA
jgi:large-conductance mechanosensitive channel